MYIPVGQPERSQLVLRLVISDIGLAYLRTVRLLRFSICGSAALASLTTN